MSIHFAPERWERIRANYRKWWAGELDRPLLAITVTGYEADVPEPPIPAYPFTSFYPESVTPREIIARRDYDLSTERYLGDAYPHIAPGFGPGACALFSGCNLRNGEGTVWIYPEQVLEPPQLHLALDRQNRWFRRMVELYQTAADYWQGAVLLEMADLGGNLDIVAAFRTTEKLLTDLYDYPQEIKRLVWEAHALWWESFESLNTIIRPVNPGYTAWVPIFSDKPYYILQCDFAYMIGPEMIK